MVFMHCKKANNDPVKETAEQMDLQPPDSSDTNISAENSGEIRETENCNSFDKQVMNIQNSASFHYLAY